MFFAFLDACGSAIVVDDVVPVDASFDATTGSDGSGFDVAAPDALDAPDDTTKFNGGGPFLCNGCVCDGTLDMCFFASGGAQPAPLADAGADADGDGGATDAGAEAGACDTDAAYGCVGIPVDCLPKPTCACLLTHHPGCDCTVDPSGNGFHVECMYP